MKHFKENYQMRVRQINPSVFRLKLIKIQQLKENVVFETIASTIPSTIELIKFYRLSASCV